MAGTTGTPKSKTKAEKPARKVLFKLSAPEANQVYPAGDFNNWDVSANPMKKDRNGLWKTTFSLDPGRYEYRFLIEGNWGNDPACSCRVPNVFGNQNWVRAVE